MSCQSYKLSLLTSLTPETEGCIVTPLGSRLQVTPGINLKNCSTAELQLQDEWRMPLLVELTCPKNNKRIPSDHQATATDSLKIPELLYFINYIIFTIERLHQGWTLLK